MSRQLEMGLIWCGGAPTGGSECCARRIARGPARLRKVGVGVDLLGTAIHNIRHARAQLSERVGGARLANNVPWGSSSAPLAPSSDEG